MGAFKNPEISWKTNSAKTTRSHKFFRGTADYFIFQEAKIEIRRLSLLYQILTNREETVEVGTLRGSDSIILGFETLQKEVEALDSMKISL